MMVHNLAIYADRISDAPRFVEGQPPPEPEAKPKP